MYFQDNFTGLTNVKWMLNKHLEATEEKWAINTPVVSLEYTLTIA